MPAPPRFAGRISFSYAVEAAVNVPNTFRLAELDPVPIVTVLALVALKSITCFAAPPSYVVNTIEPVCDAVFPSPLKSTWAKVPSPVELLIEPMIASSCVAVLLNSTIAPACAAVAFVLESFQTGLLAVLEVSVSESISFSITIA